MGELKIREGEVWRLCFTERRRQGRPRAGELRRSGECPQEGEGRRLPGFQLRAPAAAPSQQRSADHQAFMGVLNPETEQ